MQERKKIWVPTSYLQEVDKIRCWVFLSYELLISGKRRIFLPTSYIQGQVRENQESRWVCQGWSIATRRGREKKKRKERDQGRREVGSCKGKVPCALPRIPFFWFTSIWVWKRPGSVEVSAPTRLGLRGINAWRKFRKRTTLCSKSSTLKRTTLCRLKIPLRSIRSKEGPHYRLSKVWARKLSSDKRQSTFIHELDILRWFHTWAVLRSLTNARKCQLEDFCEKERYEVMFSLNGRSQQMLSAEGKKGKSQR